MRLIYRPAATADIERTYAWYERERRGLGEEFLEEVRATAQLVLNRPEAYPVLHRRTRRALVRRFPYGLFYRIVDQTTIVFVACFHARRNPAAWKRRR